MQAFVTRKMGSIATLKCLGASSRDVLGIYLTEILIVGAIAIAMGVAAGAVAPILVAKLLGGVLPLPVSTGVEVPAAVRGGSRLSHHHRLALWPLAHIRGVLPPRPCSARASRRCMAGRAGASSPPLRWRWA